MTTPEYIHLRAFARIDGTYLGIIWTISFACYIIGISNPMIGMVGSIMALASPFYAFKRLRKFRDEIRDGHISLLRSMAYYMLMFFYASILFALAQYAYFAFLDNGYIVKQYISFLSSQEAQEMIKAYGLTMKQVTEGINELGNTSPIMIALNIMTMNITIGIMLSLPVAAITKRSKVK